ncbi:sensor histidine kinase [Sphingomonas oryzagri]|uniref:histidine kinase n=1 Tax=Sphingomonas oryzagri TaxID=3042314 RepID=A0ABT6N5X0_9SPHN|nr:sensor histidine kinase [Sphingomonas oryzagri]MDH7640519.1 sensor histidine kinase [Sphingomonas oryzagri]
MAEAIRSHDWSATPLGPIDGWPAALKTTVSLIVNSQFPQCIVWGPGLVSIPNDAFLPILGDKPSALGRSFADVWSEAWHEIGPIAERAFAGQPTFIENYAMMTDRFGAEEEAHFTFCYSPIRDENGTIVGMLDTVTETSFAVRADQQLKILNRELGHRLKNVLAVTQAVTLQTLRRSATLDQAKAGVSERLAALGRATDVLTAAEWDAADLAALAEVALAGHQNDRITVSGPPVLLSSSQAIAMALALHELATNASKYGALAVPSGRIDLSWKIHPAPNPDGMRFTLCWTEMHGPTVTPPVSKGFGSTLIERTLKSAFKGNCVLDYRPAGLIFTLDAPLAGMSGGAGLL